MLTLSNPEFLLRRRPDIRAAERSLAAASARIGIATADLFPRVTFIGSVGLQAETFAGLGKNGADTWNFGPRITWAALDLGRVQARIKAADLAHQRYESGAADFLSVLDAERTLLEAQDRLAASQTRTATAFVAVYKALGGGVPVTGVKQ